MITLPNASQYAIIYSDSFADLLVTNNSNDPISDVITLPFIYWEILSEPNRGIPLAPLVNDYDLQRDHLIPYENKIPGAG